MSVFLGEYCDESFMLCSVLLLRGLLSSLFNFAKPATPTLAFIANIQTQNGTEQTGYENIMCH